MSNMGVNDELREFLLLKGVADVGFCAVEGEALPAAVSIVVRLSEAIVGEITDAPTHTYFNHYRAVNAFIDRTLLEAGFFLQSRGYQYITVAASQSINKGGWDYSGRLSHKKIACLSGLGTVGKNSLFIHKDFGSLVRLGTLLTDMPIEKQCDILPDSCGACDICVRSCPAGAIRGAEWSPQAERADMLDAAACSEYMKAKFKDIGRGAVCGICMRVCPKNRFKIQLR